MNILIETKNVNIIIEFILEFYLHKDFKTNSFDCVKLNLLLLYSFIDSKI